MTEQIPIETLHPTIQMLSDEQIQAIHHASLDILSRTGIVRGRIRAKVGAPNLFGFCPQQVENSGISTSDS